MLAMATSIGAGVRSRCTARETPPRGLAAPLSPTRPEMTLRYATLASPTLRGPYDEAMGKLQARRLLPHARPDAHRFRPGSGGCTPALLAPRTPRTALQSPE
jgi:hypothetical protein